MLAAERKRKEKPSTTEKKGERKYKKGEKGNTTSSSVPSTSLLFSPHSQKWRRRRERTGPLHSIRVGDGGDPKRVATLQFRNSQWPKFSIEARSNILLFNTEWIYCAKKLNENFDEWEPLLFSLLPPLPVSSFPLSSESPSAD